MKISRVLHMKEESIARLTSPEDYAYHIGEVASVGTHSLQVVRRQFSVKEPYKLESFPTTGISRAEYKAGLAPLRIIAGILLLALLLGIAYFLTTSWSRLEAGTTVRVGLLALAGAYGLRWAFMSRRHQLTFHMHDGKRIGWCSRAGDFKYKERAVAHVLEYLRAQGLLWESGKR